MKKLLYLAGVALVATLLLGACSKSDDGESNENEGQKEVNWTPKEGTDVRPTWAKPTDASWMDEWPMSVQIGIQPELQPYVSDGDLMCAMLKDEVRAVSGLKETGGQYYFMLPIMGNSGDGFVTLKYYCDRLHRIFTFTDWMEFDTTIQPTDQGTPYIVQFFNGEE